MVIDDNIGFELVAHGIHNGRTEANSDPGSLITHAERRTHDQSSAQPKEASPRTAELVVGLTGDVAFGRDQAGGLSWHWPGGAPWRPVS
jgi:hypothetical protein